VDERKARYAARTEARRLADAVAGADVFLGVSQPGLLTGEMVLTMNERPVIFALANPIPEILPEEVKAVRDDAVIATGRSDYPNQVNNVLCFPYIFRGALDAGATVINEDMKLACVRALAALAQVEPSDEVMRVYGGQTLHFGPEYLIPKPFDPRLMTELPVAVARAAMDSGVATRPITDFSVYRERLSRFVFRTGLVMKPVFESAKESPRRVIYAEGEDERVLRAVQTAVEEGYASPMLIGRRHVIQERACRLGLTMRLDEQVEVIDPQNNPHYDQLWQDYHRLLARRGVAAEDARFRVRGRPTVLAALMVRNGLADAMICGNIGRFHHHVDQVRDIIGLREDVQGLAAMNALVLPKGTYFICDTDVNTNPTAEEVADMAELAAEEVRRFGLTPRLALLSQSNFGTSGHSEAGKMARARELLVERNPDLQVDGEMQGDLALLERLRHRVFPFSELQGEANLLIMPNADAGNIAFSLLKTLADGVGIGPILLGTRKPAHVLTPSATVRRILNMTALAVVDCQWREQEGA
jgi:malate dehydrogenase (oxaloacetate-decarboxylating)(NADP+)